MTKERRKGKIEQFISGLPLRKVFRSIIYLAIILLIVICALGLRQYFIFQHCEKVTNQSNQLFFQFSTIKGYINETLLTDAEINIKDLADELQGFSSHIDQIMQDILIPEEFKLSFIHQTDLVGLIVDMRAIADKTNTNSKDQLFTLTTKLNLIHSRLQQFNKVLNNYTQSLLLGLHRSLAGFLAITIFVISSMLFLMNRFVSEPILGLCKKISSIQYGKNNEEINKVSCTETSVDNLMKCITKTVDNNKRLVQLFDSVDHIFILSEDLDDQKKIWEMICSVLIRSDNYCLAWIGCAEEDNNFPEPVAADGSLASTPEKNLMMLSHLFKYCRKDGEFCRSARQTAQSMDVELIQTTISDLPENFQNVLPATDGQLYSISLPIIFQENALAVLTLYSVQAGGFTNHERTILASLSTQLTHNLSRKHPNEEMPTVTGKLPPQLFKLSFIGSLTTHFTHELVNLSNGVINYTQALIDTDKDAPHEETEELLKHLFIEEKKIGKLTTDLFQFAQETHSNSRKYSVGTLLNKTTSLIKEIYKPNIAVIKKIIDSGLPEICNHVSGIQLVLLMLLQNCYARLNQKGTSGKNKNIIHINCTLDEKEAQKLIIIIQDWGVSYDQDRPSTDEEFPWRKQTFLNEYLISFGGKMISGTNPDDGSNICKLILPQSCFVQNVP